MTKQQKQFNTTFEVTKSDELPNGQFECIISTSNIDETGETILVSGIEIKDRVYRIYWNHIKYGDRLPIGKWLKIWKDGEVLRGLGQIDLNDPFAAQVYSKIKAGIIDAISIGIIATEFDGTTSTYTKSRLQEASVVSEPANEDAKITNKYLGDEFMALEKSAVDASGDSNQELKSAIETLKSRVGAVEAAQKVAADSPSVENTIKVRLAAKEVDKTAEELNKTIKVILRKENEND